MWAGVREPLLLLHSDQQLSPSLRMWPRPRLDLPLLSLSFLIYEMGQTPRAVGKPVISSSSCAPGAGLSALCVSPTTPDPHFIDEKPEAQRGEVSGLGHTARKWQG